MYSSKPEECAQKAIGRAGNVEMPGWIRGGLSMGCAVLLTTLSAYAEQQTFGDLLARAQAQSAAGHRWAPPGDNATETILSMMDVIATATPAQLVELSALLANDDTPPPPSAPNPAPPPQTATPPSATPPSATPAPPPLNDPAPTQRPVPPAPPAAGGDQIAPISSARAAVLFARGLEAERLGDLSGARRYYASSAKQGGAAAARNLGRLYDPAYLGQTAMGGVDADPALARQWYEQAIALGDAEAVPLLQSLSVR